MKTHWSTALSLLILTLWCSNSEASYRCPPEYTHYSDMDICLRLSEDTAKWEGAKYNCEKNGETLLALDNLRLINWFKTLRAQNPYWAKNDIISNNIVLEIETGSSQVVRNGHTRHACIVVINAPKYTWDDYGCYSLQRYVCEIPGKDYQLP
ncbi:hypothetical protein EB796_022692 [Bugula neritina]|uniref:C-type lectin domain-containing protein n=1 Tax=Bugula neritina TaxID=10212 RepID=A0A7J7IYK1_BUGNE|nr:hypothetical protein EB796_022692 [Bugula neritina]